MSNSRSSDTNTTSLAPASSAFCTSSWNYRPVPGHLGPPGPTKSTDPLSQLGTKVLGLVLDRDQPHCLQ